MAPHQQQQQLQRQQQQQLQRQQQQQQQQQQQHQHQHQTSPTRLRLLQALARHSADRLDIQSSVLHPAQFPVVDEELDIKGLGSLDQDPTGLNDDNGPLSVPALSVVASAGPCHPHLLSSPSQPPSPPPHCSSSPAVAVISFQDPARRLPRRAVPWEISERKSFMASALKNQLATQTPVCSSRSKASGRQDDPQEAHLQALDKSLAKLVSNLAQSETSKRPLDLDAMLSQSLPPPINPQNPQNHPRSIMAGMLRHRLKRSLAADQEAITNGVVRARNAKTLTKRQKRIQDGTTMRERRERKARSDGIIGSNSGGMIKLSPREVSMAMDNKSRSGRRNK